jgi:endonuclease/exonuclease/phosphatase (EEP) superfamily protein YafD
VIAAVAFLATLALAIATMVSFLRDWRAALLVHFRPHLAATALFCLLVGAVVDFPSTGLKVAVPLAALVVLLVNLREIVRATPRGAPGAGGRRLRLVFANLLRSNPDAQRLIDWVRREQVDVLVVAEALDAWPRQLAVLGEELPFIVRSRMGDVAIYSRHEIAGEPHHFFPAIGHAIAVEVAGLTVIGVHTASPEDAVHSAACDELIGMVGTYVENLRGPAVVVGDFNATPWSAVMRRLIARTGLAYGPGARIGTYPAEVGGRNIPTWLAIPIDIVLTRGGAAVAERRHGPRVGSDHWPVIAEIQYSQRLDPSDPHP